MAEEDVCGRSGGQRDFERGVHEKVLPLVQRRKAVDWARKKPFKNLKHDGSNDSLYLGLVALERH